MTFFYDLNKRMAELARKQTLAESAQPAVAEGSTGDYSAKKAAAGKDIGKPGKMFSKIAKSAGKEYGSKAAGERVAGAVLNKLRKGVKEGDMEEGNEFSGELAKAKATGAKEFKVDGKSYPVKEASINIPGASMPTGPFDNRHWLDITGSKDKNFKVAKPGHELDGKTVQVIAYSKNGKSVVVTADGKRYNLSPKDLEQRVREAKAKPDYIDLDKDGNKKETMKKAAADKKKSKSSGTAFDPEVARSMFANKDEHPRYDVKDTGYSKVYTRKAEPDDTDDTEVSDAPKKKGRPKGPAKGPERVTSKSYKYKSGRPTKTQENLDSDGVMMTRPSNMSSEDIESISLINKGEYDREGDMAKDDLESLAMAAKELHAILGDDENLPEWVQSKITKALDYINSSNQYMHQQKNDQEPVAEKAVSKQQQKFMGMAHAMQKGEKIKGASPELKKVAKSMKKSDVEDFAATKHKGLPNKAKTEETAEAPKEKKAKGGYNFGGGVYESFDKQFTKLLNESMNINVSMSTGQNGEPTKSITVSAEGDDAETLASLLKMAGIGSAEAACSSCGKSSCGCEELEENSPDWPTNTETSDDAMQYSGGLNGPKSTGQTTVPVIASQLRRQVSMEESVELERSLFKLYKEFK
jgi:hypothetical protein